MWITRRMKRVPLDSDLITIICTEIQSDVEAKTNTAYASQVSAECNKYLTSLSVLGCHLIGKYPVDDDGNLMDITTYVQSITFDTCYRHLAALVQLYKNNKEFILSGGLISRQHDNESRGTTRTANEESPINVAPINSAPDESTEWDIENPHNKGGSQFDSSGSSTETVTDPNELRRAADYNLRVNLFHVIRSMCDYLVDEKMSVH